jgi:hypothetical protein
MALSENEIVNQETLKLLEELTETPFPIGYARIESWRLHPDGLAFQAVICLYLNEETRIKKPRYCQSYEIGCEITNEMFLLLQQEDDRNLLYKAIEYIIHFQTYEKLLKKMDNEEERYTFITEKNAILDKLDDDLGIDLSKNFVLH